jgi:lipopolysaccharide transport system ATP-binding protein
VIFVNNVSKTFKLYERPSLRLKEIVFRRPYHKPYKALEDVSLHVGPGETMGIIGQNGSGKSTLLKLMTGVLLPDSGTCDLRGRVTGLLELGTGFNAEFSGLQNIYFNGSYLGLTKEEITQRLDKILAFAELGDFIREPIKTYSSGMVMRLAFSVATFADPQCFVVDEALSVGDAYFQQKCIQRLKSFKEEGGAIVFVSHDMNAVKVLCERAILLEKGHKVEEGDPEHVINSYNFLLAKKAEALETLSVSQGGNHDYGDKRVEILGTELIDGQKRRCEVLVSGRPCSVDIEIKGNADVEDLTIGIAVRDRFGQDVFGTNTCCLKTPLTLGKGETKKVSFQFQEFNIGPGQYSITVAAHSGEAHLEACYHWIDGALCFEVVLDTDFFFLGLARLVPRVTVEGSSGRGR